MIRGSLLLFHYIIIHWNLLPFSLFVLDGDVSIACLLISLFACFAYLLTGIRLPYLLGFFSNRHMHLQLPITLNFSHHMYHRAGILR